MANRGSASLPILMYHEITQHPSASFRKWAVTPEAFRRQMRWLVERGYRSLTMGQLVAALERGGTPGPRSVVITFDDGYDDAMRHAVPILREHGLTATFYIVAGLVGRSSEWLVDELDLRLSLADWPVIRDAAAAGFEIGSHSMTHPRLSALSAEECVRELVESRAVLEERLETPVLHLAYPYGATNDKVRLATLKAGYRSACGVRERLHVKGEDLFSMNRVLVSGLDTRADFAWRLRTGRPFGRWLGQAVRRRLRARLPRRQADA